MRLDKYLQLTRLVKKRKFTRELCSEGRLRVNEHAARPSRKISIGDVVDIKFWRRHFIIKVIECPIGNVPKDEAARYYEMLKNEIVEEDIFGTES